MNQTKLPSRTQVLGGFLLSIALAVGVYLFLTAIAPMVAGNALATSFGDIQLGSVEYVLMDISQLTFLFSPLSCAVMMVLSLGAAYLERKGSRHMGTGVDGNGSIFFVMLPMAIVSVILAELLYGGLGATFGFIPTLSCFLFFHHLVMFYGVSKAKIASMLVVTSLLATPACLLARIWLVDVFGLPLFICVTVGALGFMPVAHLLFKLMPWMTPVAPKPAVDKPTQSPNVWFMHQLFGDIGQMGVNGSSIAALGLVVFTVISYCLNPLSTGAGMGLFPMTIFAMIVTGALTIFLYDPYYNTQPILSFTSILVVSAVMVTYPTHWLVVIPSILFSAVVPTPVTGWVLKVTQYKGEYCIFPLIMLAVSGVAIPWCMFVQLVLVPLG